MPEMPNDKRRSGLTAHSLILHPSVHASDSDDRKRWIEYYIRDAVIQVRVRPDGVYVTRTMIVSATAAYTEWRTWTPDLEDYTSPAKLIPAERLPS